MLEFQEPCRRYFNISGIVTLSTISINLKRCQRFKPTKSRECCYEDILCLNNFQDCFPGGPSSVFKYSRCVELRVECVLWVNLAFVTQHAEQSWKLFLHLLEHLTILCCSGDKIKSLWAAVIVDVHSLFLNLKIKLQLSTLLANTVKALNLASLYKYWLINPRSFTFSSHNLKYGAN